ncbi:MAG: Tad domain-containing protein [Planctomycetota bacterium]|nr:Tad domain-containing protein [Planctomycetota bacterium]
MKRFRKSQRRSRFGGGAVFAISAFVLIALLGVAGLVVDMGFVKVTKTQLQAGADASTLAAAAELPLGLGPGAPRTQAEVETAAEAVAVNYAALHRSGNLSAAYVDPGRDVEFGKATYDTATGTWTLNFGATPVNMVRVNLLRNQVASNNGDVQLPLFFGGAFNTANANVRALATAAVLPGSRFEIPPGSGFTCAIIPFAMDLESWELLDPPDPETIPTGPDEYSWDPDADPPVSSGGDGIPEGDLYPHVSFPNPDPTLPNAGNRGTVDIGHHGNSTNDIKRQLLYGTNETDLSYHGGGVSASEENPLILDGETGLSAGFESELQAIIGQPRVIPIFSETDSGMGDNAQFTIIGFEPIVILAVDITGAPETLHVTFQRINTISDPCVVIDLDEEVTEETSLFSTPVLIE